MLFTESLTNKNFLLREQSPPATSRQAYEDEDKTVLPNMEPKEKVTGEKPLIIE
jgi:hypothetical protein